jgi:hypothetical protein
MSKEELSEEEVLKRVKKMLKGVDCLPPAHQEYQLAQPPRVGLNIRYYLSKNPLKNVDLY